MMRIIYSSSDGWKVIQDPTMAANDRLVRFQRHNSQRKLLDQIAEWDLRICGWNTTRWYPKPPTVPRTLLDHVEQHMPNNCS